jgi:hypothetical protein
LGSDLPQKDHQYLQDRFLRLVQSQLVFILHFDVPALFSIFKQEFWLQQDQSFAFHQGNLSKLS